MADKNSFAKFVVAKALLEERIESVYGRKSFATLDAYILPVIYRAIDSVLGKASPALRAEFYEQIAKDLEAEREMIPPKK